MPGPMLVLNRRQLYRSVQEYIDYYNRSRPHQGIGQLIPDCPAEDNPRPIRKPG